MSASYRIDENGSTVFVERKNLKDLEKEDEMKA